MPVTQMLGPALVLLLASVIVLLVSHKLRLPAVVGLLLTGLLIGPSGLGLFSQLHAVEVAAEDRKSTRLNSSHSQISYAVFCLKKKNWISRNLQSRETR